MKFRIGTLVKTADKMKIFSKGDTTKWSGKLYIVTELFNDTIPTYQLT